LVTDDDKKVIMVRAFLDAGYREPIAAVLRFHGPPHGRSARATATLVTVFLPKLRQAGVTEEVLHRITVDNPRRFLAFVPKKAHPIEGG
jgi:predicted metal-dependent phosphotriesterase family hydrolase